MSISTLGKTIVFVADTLNSKSIHWVLAASGALYVQGIKVIPQDLDFFVEAKNLPMLEKEFAKYITTLLHYFDEKDNKFPEFQMRINNIDIEICELEEPDKLITVDFLNTKIPVSPLESYLKFYGDNPKHADRVKLIRQHLKLDRFSLKDFLFNKTKLEKLSNEIKAVYPEFENTKFVAEVVEKFPELELKQRISHITFCLQKYLPPAYPEALKIILKALPQELDPSKTDNDFGEFIYAPYLHFVATYGCQEKYFDLSLNAIHDLTKRFSGEDAIRYFINAFPKNTLLKIKAWSQDKNYHVRRLASEGTRPSLPWSQKIKLKPGEAVEILDNLFFDKTRYVTRSVANHLNDISKKDPDLVIKTLKSWQISGKQNQDEMDFITKHSLRTLIKKGNKDALALLGHNHSHQVKILDFTAPNKTSLNSSFTFNFSLTSPKDESIIVDYIVHFQTKNNKLSPKVFKLTKLNLNKNQSFQIAKNHKFKQFMTTRTLYIGEHHLEIQVNGVSLYKHMFYVE